MVVATAIRALGDLLESVIVQLAEKTGVSWRHGEVLRADVLLKILGDEDSKGTTMRLPTDTGLKLTL
jgi:hypothetical protein